MRRALKAKATLAIIVALVVLLLLPALAWADDPSGEAAPVDSEEQTTLVAQADRDPVSYLDETGEAQAVTNYTLVNASELPDRANVTMSSGWYVVSGTMAYNNRITISGDVTIVLCDGARLDCHSGIWLMIENTLTIYGQDQGSGELIATASDPDCAGIGGNDGGSTDNPDARGNCGTVNIFGGSVKASGMYPNGDAFNAMYGGAGIGGGHAGSGGDITISGPHTTVEANGGYRAAGIGTGNMHDNFGRIKSITITNGAHVVAQGGGCGAGIGGGYTSGGFYGSGSLTKDSIITISGEGTYVQATGGGSSANISSGAGAGIGGGKGANGCDEVSILDGATVVVRAPNNAQPIGYGMGYFRSGDLSLYETAMVWYREDNGNISRAQTSDRVEMCRMTKDGDGYTIHIGPCTHEGATYDATETGHTIHCGACAAESLGELEHEFGDDNICDVCGYEAAELPLVQVYGHSLTLDGSIGVNTYLVLASAVLQNAEDYTVEFWDGEELYASSTVAEGFVNDTLANNIRGFSFRTVAKEMDTNFVLRIKNPDGDYIDFANADATIVDGGEGLAYPIYEYLDETIANTQDAEMLQLAKDMRAYGIYAKHYFAVRDEGSTEALPVVDGFVPVGVADLGVTFTNPTDIAGFTFMGTTLNLLDETSFRLYFRSDDPSGLFIMGGGELLRPIQKAEGVWYVEKVGIAAQDLDKMYAFTVSNYVDSTIAYLGPFSYASWAIGESGNEDLARLAMALYHYNQAAKAYFN